jgi:glycosyltransferase involved in cell wall biosynthesis
MIICKVWDADYPWDVRVEKVCEALLTAQHEVHLICRNKKMNRKYEFLDGIHVHRIPCFTRSAKLNELANFPAFFNPLWIHTIWRVVTRHRAQLILVRDLPLALAAVLVGRLKRLPVILDMAENYPEMMKDLWTLKNLKLRNIFLRNPLLVKVVEFLAINLADHIIVVVHESATRLIKMGVRPSKLSIVMNTPPLASRRLLNEDEPALFSGSRDRDFLIVYLGLLEYPRGIETAIRAMKVVHTRFRDCKLVLIGKGKDEQFFKKLVNELDLEDTVIFRGWMQYENALREILNSDVGLVPHHAVPSWNTTIPNKLFDYMSLGKAVIVSDAHPTKRIVEKIGCGLVFRDRVPNALADAIIALYIDRKLCVKFGERGREVFEKEYNWDRDSERLLRAMEQTLGKASHD